MKRRLQQGFTLVELMVSMVLGLVIVGALALSYLGTLQTQRTTTALSQMTDDGQAALALLTQQLRQAGYNPRVISSATGVVAERDLGTTGLTLFGCDGGFSVMTAALKDVACSSATSLSGAFAVVYVADTFGGMTTGAGLPTDCLGTGVTASTDADGTYTVVQNRFYIKGGTLMCAGGGGTSPFSNPQPFVENVESMSLSFGVSAPAVTSTAVAGYLTAMQLGPAAPGAAAGVHASLAALTPAERWGLVRSVRVCIVMRSADQVIEASDIDPASYLGCDGELKDIMDGRLRRAFETTVLLRNRMVK